MSIYMPTLSGTVREITVVDATGIQTDGEIVEIWSEPINRHTFAKVKVKDGSVAKAILEWEEGHYVFQIEPQSHKEMDFSK